MVEARHDVGNRDKSMEALSALPVAPRRGSRNTDQSCLYLQFVRPDHDNLKMPRQLWRFQGTDPNVVLAVLLICRPTSQTSA